MKKELIELRVNGRKHELAIEPSELLLDVLRQELDFTGSKRGCDDSSCGACTVLVDGVPTLSCTWLELTCLAPTEPLMIFRPPTALDLSFQLPTLPFCSCALPTLFFGNWVAA